MIKKKEWRKIMKKLKETILKEEYVVIVVHTEWCGFCKKFAPVFEEVSKEHGKQYVFAKLDAQLNEELAKEFKVNGFPTILFMKKGKEIAREMGYMTKENFTAVISKHFN